MILGVDTSTYLEEIASGAKYFRNGVEVDPLDLFIKNNVNYQRLRLWVNPHGENGEDYLGGTCDIECFIKTAKIMIKKGFHIILDFHYSDFWVDPGKQTLPKSWQNLNEKELILKIYEYTLSVLKEIKKNNIPLFAIQIGNEITNGMLWPIGKLKDNGKDLPRGNYDNLISLIKSGIKASREVFKESKIILHLERSGDKQVYKEFFTNMEKANVDYDIIGASYYPYWHGTIEQVVSNLVELKSMFKKEVMFMELGYAFTLEDYIKTYNGQEKQLVLNEEFIKDKSHYIPFPLSKEGQKQFLEKFLKICGENDIDGVFYWEPLWIPGKDICWASKEGQKYIHEENKSTRNEWANQALYDYSGNALPALEVYKN